MIHGQTGIVHRVALVKMFSALVALSVCSALRAKPMDSSASVSTGNVMRGWRTFHEKQCAKCHAIWGHGGQDGPDLGRFPAGRLSEERLAGIMWNHIPKMFRRMERIGQPPTRLTRTEMSDLHVLLDFVGQLDQPGDPARGKEILQRKGCQECHSIDAPSGDVTTTDLFQWARHSNPVVWAQMMWQHAPMMAEAMNKSGVNWPKLEGKDLADMVAYVRSVVRGDGKIYLQPGRADRGKRLFLEKKCDTCHPGNGPDLVTAELPYTIGALAATMWNHSSEMEKVMGPQDVFRNPLEAQELTDILTYVLSLRPQERNGNPGKGKIVFAAKGCGQCHHGQDGGKTSPASPKPAGDHATTEAIAATLWNHGSIMLARMGDTKATWPLFQDGEMVDLLAYWRTVAFSTRETNSEMNQPNDAGAEGR